MDKKYYTPEICELHVGFEYERSPYYYDTNQYGDYRKEIFEPKLSFDYISLEIGKGKVRVKFLDREDIESLGWQMSNDLFYFDVKGIESGDNEYFLDDKLYPFPDYELHFSYDDSHLIILDFNRDIIFQGAAKNKSELRKLMKQLNIK